MSDTLSSDSIVVTSVGGQAEAKSNPEPAENSESETLENPEAQDAVAESEGEDEETDGEESKDKDDSDDESEESDDEAPERVEKKTGISKRISKLVKQKQALKQELEYFKSQMMKGQGQTQGETSESQAEAEPSQDDFDKYEEYHRAVTRFEAKQALKSELDALKQTITKPQIEAEAKKAQDAFGKKIKAFAKEHSDYTDAVKSLDGIEVDKSVEQVIVTSEHGPALLYELGKNPDLAEEIAELPPHLQMKEIGKLEAKIEARIQARKTPRTTKAPTPPNPVGSKSEGKKSIFDPNLSQAEYEQLRKEQIKQANAWG